MGKHSSVFPRRAGIVEGLFHGPSRPDARIPPGRSVASLDPEALVEVRPQVLAVVRSTGHIARVAGRELGLQVPVVHDLDLFGLVVDLGWMGYVGLDGSREGERAPPHTKNPIQCRSTKPRHPSLSNPNPIPRRLPHPTTYVRHLPRRVLVRAQVVLGPHGQQEDLLELVAGEGPVPLRLPAIRAREREEVLELGDERPRQAQLLLQLADRRRVDLLAVCFCLCG